MESMTQYSFPNDLIIHWTLMIVLYPYITGFVAGAFIVSSLYHVFGRSELAPVGRLSLLTSLSFLLVATLPLMCHLGHPERALNIFLTPNFSSAMAGFGFVFNFYLVVVLLEIWLVYREHIIETARRSRGLKRRIYKILALGVYDLSPESRAIDERAIRVLAAIGIPAACILHGYVGFIFGALKSNPWWSTPLMPIIFLFSAVVSGIALLIVIYQLDRKIRGEPIDRDCVASLARWLWLFVIVTVSLELLEIITLAYEQSEEWEVIGTLLSEKLWFSFISVQMIFGSLLPFLLLMIVVLMHQHLHEKVRNTLAFVAAFILLIQVFSMRWNVVIGGQMFSKSLRGFRDYQPEFFEKEGILVAILIMAIPFIVLSILNHFFPALSHGRGDDAERQEPVSDAEQAEGHGA